MQDAAGAERRSAVVWTAKRGSVVVFGSLVHYGTGWFRLVSTEAIGIRQTERDADTRMSRPCSRDNTSRVVLPRVARGRSRSRSGA